MMRYMRIFLTTTLACCMLAVGLVVVVFDANDPHKLAEMNTAYYSLIVCTVLIVFLWLPWKKILDL